MKVKRRKEESNELFMQTVANCVFYAVAGNLQSLSFGADSNGSGVVALLELARLFAKLYASSRSHARCVSALFINSINAELPPHACARA